MDNAILIYFLNRIVKLLKVFPTKTNYHALKNTPKNQIMKILKLSNIKKSIIPMRIVFLLLTSKIHCIIILDAGNININRMDKLKYIIEDIFVKKKNNSNIGTKMRNVPKLKILKLIFNFVKKQIIDNINMLIQNVNK